MFCKTIILGAIGKKEDKNLSNGTAVSKLSVATKKKTKNIQGQWEDETTWHDVTVYGKSAEYIQKYCHKGDTLLLEGENQLHKWTGKDGKTQYRYFVNASKVTKVKDGKIAKAGVTSMPDNYGNKAPEFDDDLPF